MLPSLVKERNDLTVKEAKLYGYFNGQFNYNLYDYMTLTYNLYILKFLATILIVCY